MDPSALKNRKEILQQLNERNAATFLNSLPMDRKQFVALFEYLDKNLGEDDCNNDMAMTLRFLKQIQIEDRASIIQWFHDQGAYCDCEVIGNVEERFRENISSYNRQE